MLSVCFAFCIKRSVCVNNYDLIRLIPDKEVVARDDSVYEKNILIYDVLVDIIYNDKNDSFEIKLKKNIKTDNNILWIGETSTSVVFRDTDIVEMILPDMNMEENIKLIGIGKNEESIIIKNKLIESNNYTFVFYIVNDLDEFISCIDDKTKLLRYYNCEGQIILEIPHDRMPDAGMTIIRITNISYSNKLNKISYQVNKY